MINSRVIVLLARARVHFFLFTDASRAFWYVNNWCSCRHVDNLHKLLV